MRDHASGDDVQHGLLPILPDGREPLEVKCASVDRIRVDLELARRMEMMDKTRRRTVPQICIGELYVGGDHELAALEQAGRLDPLLLAD